MKTLNLFILSLVILCILSLITFLFRNDLIFFSIFMFFLGILILFLTEYVNASKATKKLGYGPLDLETSGFFIAPYWKWKQEYNKQKGKVVTLDEINKWEKEYNNIRKKNIFYFVLGILLSIIGFLLIIYFLV